MSRAYVAIVSKRFPIRGAAEAGKREFGPEFLTCGAATAEVRDSVGRAAKAALRLNFTGSDIR